MIAAKLAEGGPAQLSDQDRNHLARATKINATANHLLQPCGVAKVHAAVPSNDPAAAVAWITSGLSDIGICAYMVDLRRQRFAIPVVRVVAPGLQVEPSSLVSIRLAKIRSKCGLADCPPPEIDLF